MSPPSQVVVGHESAVQFTEVSDQAAELYLAVGGVAAADQDGD